MMDFHVTCNVDKFVKDIKNLKEKQIPFAAKEAVNTNAFRSRRALIKDYPRKFNMRNKGLPNLIRVNKATKQIPAAAVYLDKVFMVKQETGGVKNAQANRNVAIPREVVTEKGMTSNGFIKKNFYVSSLLAASQKDQLKHRKRNGKMRTEHKQIARVNSKYKPFKIDRNDGVSYIARHVAGSRKLEWMYALYPKVVVPARWPWNRIVKFFFDKYIAKDFADAYAKAISTAKK